MYGKLYVDDRIHNRPTNYIYCKEAKLERLHLKLFFQSTSHSEKDKLASISYDYDTCTILYEAYAQAKVTIAENTMPSASNFEPACISSIRQKMISPTSYQSSNCKSNTSEIFISSQYAKQNNLLPFTKGTVLKLRDGTKVTIV
ncbi:hypothetical protein RhiirA1_471814 [Rhizophagus irregularis]|uniref:Uncharacterized protein n=1 Tax=Rhizophagus irregularis TaxID=588596 RepID=A0A2N0R3L7_9GLOM|nr:hypothetical protein RhiirA1_471814 [Rhizophagus irregularis]